MSQIVLKNIDKFYGSNHVLKNLNLTVNDGEFMTLLGPSGCGKTTTLRVIAGLEKPQNGTIEMDGHLVVNAKELYFEDPGKRGMNLVFQSYALWPHMTVFQNVAFVLNVQKVPKEETKRRVMDALERMRIEQYADRYPSELSGGQQQRVAIARAIVSQPKVLLLDEPLSNLDAKLRIDMRSEIKRLHHEMGTTIVYVTHDQVEALTMSTRIAIFFEGELEQVAAPMDLYQNPISLRVADFIGNPRINFVEGQAKRGEDGGLVKTDDQWKQYNDINYKQSSGIEQLSWFYFRPGLEALPTSGTVLSPSNTAEFASLAYEDYEKEFLTHYNAQTFCDWFNPSYNAMYEPGWSIRQRIDTTDPRKIAGETALEITLEYVPKLAQCKPEEFDNVWNEFAGKLADLPLREYEALATEMLQAGAENYK